ncbi:MAG: indole-3-glycerol phosphate synthase TrpC [Clostridium sp.]|jgi:indole-3-glycerol phosphate synthase|uniref:indole-3-glycerol phosphate synthase TrpC n=1 Tax=Clostridium sp. TaxID=1506 RepID=UPI0025BBF6D9|nr:indole-3-glycerol phosphate synthase TrpC [Clostridium sp.]MCH3963850.1 indole-3-glycerol phosphate synthase TrpC [Clostridium sp.]MCI1716969.1 indole-3-glycerol phosphate synthase TrpC [Clostridium sp.]MCI1801312.1 indole-3-glycerol phosphate synthase TrpC [Clostridium sp.]MCI1815158.1 indole-3-glycerol phosphate synthase TrpC [Clostridium sp.]MCI1872058.1 indole-3-glycerol phosphate synthase TrpC [Clostridium sp.]
MILDDIVASKKKEIEVRKKNKPLQGIISELDKSNNSYSMDFRGALSKDNISIIGEIKKASPSRGVIVEDFYPENIARVYEELDIDAVSVLTEGNYFKGKDEYLKSVKNIVSKPVLRKDFIVDEYQIYESKLLGADAILLIVGVLNEEIHKFYKLASSMGLQCIVEVHNKRELDRALDIDSKIIGINNRNLENFTVDLKNTEDLIKYINQSITVVSESGIKTSEDFKYIKSLPVNGVLIGEGFMKRLDSIDDMKEFIDDIKNN